jgi:Zn-dependent peptidase ImmA (M78 family)/transcriptional regulator with XRE-family HTH domain
MNERFRERVESMPALFQALDSSAPFAASEQPCRWTPWSPRSIGPREGDTVCLMDFAIGPRIAEVRKRAGLGLEDVALRARVPAAALAVLEEGTQVEISTAAVARLARALDVDVSDLIEPGANASQPSVFFRQSGVPDFLDRDRGRVVDALRDARSIAVVDGLLGRTYLRAALAPVEVGAVPYKQGYELAERVRRTLGQPIEPLGSMRDLLEERFGVPVLASNLHAPNLLALTAKERGADCVAVLVNEKRTGSTRVDLAHELAHVLFDAPVQDIDYWIDLENDHESDTSRTEQRAKAFAAELLIPRKGLIEKFGHTHERLAERTSLAASVDLARRVGEYFGTPPELTTNHLDHHGYIAKELREGVLKGLSWPTPAAPKRPPMLHRRLADALGAGLLTQMRARELLGLSAWNALPATVQPER